MASLPDDQEDSLLDDSLLDNRNPSPIQTTEKEAFWEKYKAFILPVFGVLSAFIGPWVLVGLLYLVLLLIGHFFPT